MPTPGGLPRAGEVWEATRKLPPDYKPNVTRFVVISRGTGSYWSMRVYTSTGVRRLMLDGAWMLKRGELKFVGPAGPKTRKKLGLLWLTTRYAASPVLACRASYT
jgi:hypothetical protein